MSLALSLSLSLSLSLGLSLSLSLSLSLRQIEQHEEHVHNRKELLVPLPMPSQPSLPSELVVVVALQVVLCKLSTIETVGKWVEAARASVRPLAPKATRN